MMLHMVKQAINGLRNLVGLGVISSLNDTGGAMTVNLATGSNVNRADVEVATPWGFSSSPPADGMITLVFSLGGDASNLMALHPGNPSARFGNLAVGESVLYGADGCRVHVRAGVVEIWAPTIKMFGNLVVEGHITATGNITAGEGGGEQVDLLGHQHDYLPGTGAATPTTAPISGT